MTALRHVLFSILVAVPILVAALAVPAVKSARSASAPAQAPTATATPSSGCTAYGYKSAAPAVVALGQDVTVTLRVEPRCWSTPRVLHVAFVLDASDSMFGTPALRQANAATSVARTLGLGATPGAKAAVVSFDANARLETALTDNQDKVFAAIDRTKPSRRADDPSVEDGNSRMDLGLREARRALRQGLEGAPDELTQIIVLMSDGIPDGGCAASQREAVQAEREGVAIVTVCMATWCREQCMSDLASSDYLFFRLGDLATIQLLFQQLVTRIRNVYVRDLVVTDTLGSAVVLVPASARPTPVRADGQGRWLAWALSTVPADGVTYTLRVRPQATGQVPTNVEAVGVARASVGGAFTFTFPMPMVQVIGPTERPSATATATAVVATATATRTGSPVPSVTSEPTAVTLYLPEARRGSSQ